MVDQLKKRKRRGGASKQTLTAVLSDGQTLEYLPDLIGEGGMKDVYFTEDKTSVVCFFKDHAAGQDPQRISRLEAILGRYNPGLDPRTGSYWRELFCWPTAIVVQPRLGIVTPAYPSNYYFATGPFQGKEKEGRWFSSAKLRKMLPDAERGTWLNYLSLCIRMARAVRRLHQAGLAHSDLSPKNVLVDPSIGSAVVIDIDSLVVPQLYPPDVMGTPGYIAPEVLSTATYPLDDPRRISPSASTDQHALAVLIYEYLLYRHPLRGKKVNSRVSSEEDEFLSMGAKALFVEHPTDRSNPSTGDMSVLCSALGPDLHKLFMRAFVDGLHAPNLRPAAIEWERGLIKTWQMIHPCQNPACTHRWFVFDESNPKCPFCNTRLRGTIPVLKLRKESRPGQWTQDATLVLYNNASLFKWHVFDNVFPGEAADRAPQAYCVFHEGQWLLVNQQLDSLTSPGGNRVPHGQAVLLREGAQIRLAQEGHGRIAEVHMVSV